MQDEYYTNGLTLQFRFLAKKIRRNRIKKIYTIGIGQYIYTPYRSYVPKMSDQDRPFAGYLFLNFSVNNFYKNESSLNITYQLGLLGPDSQAESIQKWLHKTFNLSAIAGWKYQIQNQIGINIQAVYLRNVAYSGNRKLDFNAFAKINAGTVFDKVSLGFVSRIGFKPLNPVYHSIFFNSNISTNGKKFQEKEFYFFVKFQLIYVAYNATIQGSLFNDNSPLTFHPTPLRASVQVGFEWAIKHFNFGYAVSFLSKTVNNNRVKSHNFGSISMACRF